VSGNGALVLTDGHLFATQRQNESFALAEVAGYGGVGIGLGNHVLTRTDASGVALIPMLVPYQRNSVQLDPTDLPVSAEIDSIEQIAVPARRSVVKVIFPVRSGRAALLKIQLDDGSVAPAGATVQIEGDPQEFYVARRGEAFVTGLKAINRVRLTWKAQQCTFDVALPPESVTEIARIGPLPCIGIAR
jgi:outer membrane usher protein